jgi:hypothetical protein
MFPFHLLPFFPFAHFQIFTLILPISSIPLPRKEIVFIHYKIFLQNREHLLWIIHCPFQLYNNFNIIELIVKHHSKMSQIDNGFGNSNGIGNSNGNGNSNGIGNGESDNSNLMVALLEVCTNFLIF